MPGHFLMLTTRTEPQVAKSERAALLRFTGLSEDDLVNVRLEREPFPSISFRDWDGIILCGSSFDVSAPREQKSLRQLDIERNLSALVPDIVAADFPFLGLCYGLGIVTKCLGGVVGTQISEEISAPTLEVTAAGRLDPILYGVPNQFRAYVGHHESVIEPADEMTTLVTGAVAPVQMARVSQNIYLTQFHPELDLDGINVRIDSFAAHGYYPEDQQEAVRSRVREADVSPAHQILSNFVGRYWSPRSAA